MWSLSAKEKERQTECKAPLQKEAQVGLGPGTGVLKGKVVTEQCWILRAGGQAATFICPDALLPTSK